VIYIYRIFLHICDAYMSYINCVFLCMHTCMYTHICIYVTCKHIYTYMSYMFICMYLTNASHSVSVCVYDRLVYMYTDVCLYVTRMYLYVYIICVHIYISYICIVHIHRIRYRMRYLTFWSVGSIKLQVSLVSLVSRIDKIIGLFCRISSLL